MQPDFHGDRPLLTIAVPTFNRAEQLKLLLETLAPQVAALPDVELLISDNASSDNTQHVVEEQIAAGLRCKYIRNASNIEADPNFLQCYREARGRYVWIFGDDDVLLPRSLHFIFNLLRTNECEIVYIRPFGFVHDVDERGQRNSSPHVRAYGSAKAFLKAVGLRGDLVMLSAVIVNKDRIEAAPHPDFAEGKNTNLLQVGWAFTALKHFRRGFIVERGLFAACERNPRRQFDIIGVFGPNWARAARLFLAPDEQLIDAALNDQLYSWFVANWYAARRHPEHTIIVDPVGQMRRAYGDRPRFWVLTWPLLAWPMLPAGAWLALLRGVRHVDAALERARNRPIDNISIDKM
ncbi:MAG TPA: glycosyltransferase [Acidobacteriaceae bacterium]|nr:glycosyltransferase [Acidobacteriaceae bacterium]